MFFPNLPILEASRPALAPALVDDRAWSRVTRLADRLPPALTTHYLECRLADDVTRVDYLTCGTLPAGSPALLSGQHPRRDFDAALIRSPAWQRIRAFFVDWADPDGALAAFVPIAWMEFDLDGPEREHPEPQIGFCVHPALAGASGAAPSPQSEAFRAPTERALATLRGRPLGEQTTRTLRRCLEHLPAGGRILHLAPMTQRHGDLLRCVPELPADRVLDYLDAIGWRGPRPEVIAILDHLCRPRGGLVKIDVDIDGEVLPKFAAAAEFSSEGPAAYVEAGALLDRLVHRGLCSAAKRDALAAWPGRASAPIEGYGLPVTIDRVMDFKVVAWPDGRLEAKTYLGISPGFSLV